MAAKKRTVLRRSRDLRVVRRPVTVLPEDRVQAANNFVEEYATAIAILERCGVKNPPVEVILRVKDHIEFDSQHVASRRQQEHE